MDGSPIRLIASSAIFIASSEVRRALCTENSLQIVADHLRLHRQAVLKRATLPRAVKHLSRFCSDPVLAKVSSIPRTGCSNHILWSGLCWLTGSVLWGIMAVPGVNGSIDYF